MPRVTDPAGPPDRADSVTAPAFQETGNRSSVVATSRVVEVQRFYPGYVIPLMAATLALLIVAMAFAAQLFDAIGRPISDDQLLVLKDWGLSLTGVALSAFVWGSVILPGMSRTSRSFHHSLSVLVLSAAVCVETVWLAGPWLIHRLQDSMSAAQRQCAVQLLVSATAQHDGIPVPDSGTIPSLVLRAPVLGLHCENLPAISAATLRTALRGMAQQRLGTAEQIYDDLFIPSVQSLRDAYNEYVLAQVRLVDAISSIPQKQSLAWTKYLQQLAQSGLSPGRIPRREWPSVAATVQAMGVPVPADWNPANRPTFMAASASALRHEADTTYSDFVTQHFHANLPTGLDWDAFCGEPTIQNRWLAMIRAPARVALSPGMGFETFSRDVYEPQLQSVFLPQLENLSGPPATFSATGRFAAAGQVAAAWVTAPAMLLYMIVLCILWHTGRLVHLGCRILLPAVRASTRRIAQACLIAVAVIPLAWLPGNQPLLGVIGSELRNAVLLGYDFGYDPDAAGRPHSVASLLAPGPAMP
jgi:hypothetical protein